MPSARLPSLARGQPEAAPSAFAPAAPARGRSSGSALPATRHHRRAWDLFRYGLLHRRPAAHEMRHGQPDRRRGV